MIAVVLYFASPLLADVQAAYKDAQALRGSFTQVVTRKVYGTTQTEKGTLYLARPDKMRWDYVNAKAKPDKSMIFDGKTLWVIEPSNLQVLRHKTVSATLPAAVAFLNGGDLSKDFDVTTPDATTLVLVPKEVSAKIKTLTFVIDPKTKRVVKSIVLDHQGDTNTFEFHLDEKPIDGKTFQFSPKRVPTYQVIDV
jgi:chaperone LolA